ncbi:MAG: hypothetical protein QOD41_1718, partial [Cryptosporangiaceae bacterium]|nr:hypothetical protein [Cryptosporangiaceae bacterium]
ELVRPSGAGPGDGRVTETVAEVAGTLPPKS